MVPFSSIGRLFRSICTASRVKLRGLPGMGELKWYGAKLAIQGAAKADSLQRPAERSVPLGAIAFAISAPIVVPI